MIPFSLKILIHFGLPHLMRAAIDVARFSGFSRRKGKRLLRRAIGRSCTTDLFLQHLFYAVESRRQKTGLFPAAHVNLSCAAMKDYYPREAGWWIWSLNLFKSNPPAKFFKCIGADETVAYQVNNR